MDWTTLDDETLTREVEAGQAEIARRAREAMAEEILAERQARTEAEISARRTK